MIARALDWFGRFPRDVLRLAVALGIGITAGAAVYLATAAIPPGGNSSDFQAQWFTARAFDGLNLGFRTPDDLNRFVADVVPLLQQRGLFRTAYDAETLRGQGYRLVAPAGA